MSRCCTESQRSSSLSSIVRVKVDPPCGMIKVLTAYTKTCDLLSLQVGIFLTQTRPGCIFAWSTTRTWMIVFGCFWIIVEWMIVMIVGLRSLQIHTFQSLDQTETGNCQHHFVSFWLHHTIYQQCVKDTSEVSMTILPFLFFGDSRNIHFKSHIFRINFDGDMAQFTLVSWI